MTTVLIVDDHPLIRTGLSSVLDTADDLEVVGTAANGEAAIELAHLEPDVVLMDLSMPGIGGVEAIRRLIQLRPDACVVVLTSSHDDNLVTQAIAAGAMGYLLKDTEPELLVSAVRSAARGDVPLDPRIARALLPAESPRVEDSLSGREREVLDLLTQGMSNRQIGRALGIAERTVKVHLGHLFRRIGVADRTSAAMWARDHLEQY